MLLAVKIKRWVAGVQFSFAVTTVEQALGCVAFFIADAIGKYLPAVDVCCAVLPRLLTERTIISVKVAFQSVAFFVATSVPLLGLASLDNALFLLVIDFRSINILVVVTIENLAGFSFPFWRADALVVAKFVDATRVLPAWA